MNLREDIEKLIDYNYQVYHYIYDKNDNLTIMIEKKDNSKVDLEDCIEVSKKINNFLDEHVEYDVNNLDVCSPGITKELYTKEHYEKQINQKINLTLKKNKEFKEIEGILKQVNDNSIILDEYEFKFEEIKKARCSYQEKE